MEDPNSVVSIRVCSNKNEHRFIPAKVIENIGPLGQILLPCPRICETNAARFLAKTNTRIKTTRTSFLRLPSRGREQSDLDPIPTHTDSWGG